MDTILNLPTINIQFVSQKTEGEVYNAVIHGVIPAVAVIAQDKTLLHLAELELKEALALICNYKTRIFMNERMAIENQKGNI